MATIRAKTMQDYIDFANKNGVTLEDTGSCQFCGAATQRGIHECLEIFNLGFQQLDFSQPENHIYRFFIVDAHALQHPEIHGRWSNHFHLTRLHLIFKYDVAWTYAHSPKLSDYLNRYKADKPHEILHPPAVKMRGEITTTEVMRGAQNVSVGKAIVKKWANEVYGKWAGEHKTVDAIASGFLQQENVG